MGFERTDLAAPLQAGSTFVSVLPDIRAVRPPVTTSTIILTTLPRQRACGRVIAYDSASNSRIEPTVMLNIFWEEHRHNLSNVMPGYIPSYWVSYFVSAQAFELYSVLGKVPNSGRADGVSVDSERIFFN
jgi:hypothetical protein